MLFEAISKALCSADSAAVRVPSGLLTQLQQHQQLSPGRAEPPADSPGEPQPATHRALQRTYTEPPGFQRPPPDYTEATRARSSQSPSGHKVRSALLSP